MNDNPRTSRLTPSTYVAGFVLSLIFTIAAYLLVVHHLVGRRMLIASVAILALAQFFTQLILFLHLGKEVRPRWKLMVFLFMAMVVAIVVFGSLWIMYGLNYHANLQQMYHYLNSQNDGI